MRRDRWDALGSEQQDEILSICPDAAFEIRAKSSRPDDLGEKMRTYLANGAQIAVLIDPWREPETRRNSASVALDPELPGFVLDEFR